MPHISVKMLKGRTDAQKQKLAVALKDALKEALGCSEKHISVSIQDYTAQEWQDEFKKEITDNMENVWIKPQYDPKDLL
ncbi:MAG TPA: tautomerase family protein [Clostridia bacterium]|jgi:4-oxalocrotonate tautomerase